MPDPKRRYSEDEVRSILDRALRHGHDTTRGIAHDELVAAATEVGISPAALDAAIREAEEHRAEAELRDAVLERRRRGFRGHLTSFLAVNAMLVGINALTIFLSGVFVPWALFPILGWGLGLYFHGRAAYATEVSERELMRERAALERRERKLEKERRKAQEDAEKRARRDKLEKSAAELGAAVEEGVSELLGALTKEIGGAKPKRDEREKKGKPGRGKKSKRRVRFEIDGDEREAEAEREREAEADDEPSERRRRR